MALRGWITWRHWRLPPRPLLILMVVVGTVAVGLEYRTIFGRVPGVALLAVFMALKLLELRAARDALAVVLLSYFLVLAQFLFTQTITTALIASLTLLITTATLAAATDERPKPLHQLRRAAFMLVQALPFMLLLFILFPRIQGPLWGLPQDRFSATTGLSDTMSPGSIAMLSQSDAIAFRVKFDGNPPSQSELYWRGPVMPQFDGRSWRVSHSMISYNKVPYVITGSPVGYEITLEPHGKSWLFLLQLPEALPSESAFTDDLQLLSRMPVRNRLRYTLRSFPETPLFPTEKSRLLQEAMTLPATGNPRTRAIAAEWRARHGDNVAAIRASAEDFFARQLLTYTLNPPLLGDDVIDGFLFDTRRGFCEHFAAAFVFALRAAGVPARVVAGYQGGELNTVDGYFEVRQYDAHAWTEIWMADRGWIRVDPTAISAPRRIDSSIMNAVPAGEPLPFLARTDIAWLKELRNRADAIANGWNQWVLGYTPQRQREFLQNLGLNNPDWMNMTAIMTALCGVVMIGLTAWILYQRRRLDPIVSLWLHFTRRLAKRGVIWQPWEGPVAFAKRAGNQLPGSAEAINEIAQHYAALRYGNQPGKIELRHFKSMISNFHP
jgi:transglutaminase-like putative cysteine protease